MERERLSKPILNLSVSQTQNKFGFSSQRPADAGLNTNRSLSKCLQEATELCFCVEQIRVTSVPTQIFCKIAATTTERCSL